MSIPKRRPPLPGAEAGPRPGQYFEREPVVESRPRTVHLHLGELSLDLQADRGVFGSKAVDLGTLTLLREAAPPPAAGDRRARAIAIGP